MMRFVILLAAFVLITSLAKADDVAVFEVQWGKGRERQTRVFAIAFNEAAAPYTVYNFKKLVREGFYLKTYFHRAIPNYLVQGGDPLSKKKDRFVVGTGGPGYTIPPEIRLRHGRGSVAMGRLPDNINPKRLSNGSQFYICLVPLVTQDGKDTVFGYVVAGMDSVDEFSRALADTNQNPVTPIRVTRTAIIDRSQLGQPFPRR